MKPRVLLSNTIIFLFIVGLLAIILRLLRRFNVVPSTRETDLIAVVLAIVVSALFVIKSPVRVRRFTVFVIYLFVTVEVSIQALAFFGLLPGVSFYYDTPYARVYWSKEGLGNSITNRYGWYYPPLRLDSKYETVVLIGDSFIQGVQISPHHNIGVVLEDHLNSSTYLNAKTEVISLGMSGLGPSYYLELLKYSNQYFKPTSAVIFVFVGNDFRNSSRKVQSDVSPRDYVYYMLDESGNIRLLPESMPALQELQSGLEEKHSPSFHTIVTSLFSYVMLPHIAITLIENAQDILNKDIINNNASLNPQNDLQHLGIDDFIFKTPLTFNAEEAVRITHALLLRCQQYAETHSINLLVVTIPVFPKIFYETEANDSRSWELRFGEYDFLLPETMLVDFAQKNAMAILPMGKYIREQKLSPGEINMLYINGTGHWSTIGHDFFAQAVYSYLTKNND